MIILTKYIINICLIAENGKEISGGIPSKLYTGYYSMSKKRSLYLKYYVNVDKYVNFGAHNICYVRLGTECRLHNESSPLPKSIN